MQRKSALTLVRKTRFSIFDFKPNPESLVRSLDFYHKLFEVSKSRLRAIYFLGSVRVRRLVADNQSP
jgi:hypothetical protein